MEEGVEMRFRQSINERDVFVDSVSDGSNMYVSVRENEIMVKG